VKIIKVNIIKDAEIIKKVLAFIYFCKTQIGISSMRATKFHIHKKSPTSNGDSKTSQKKNIIVK